MNVQIVDLTPEYIDGALDVFYESNLLHCSGAPDYFRKTPKEHSRPYLEWIIVFQWVIIQQYILIRMILCSY